MSSQPHPLTPDPSSPPSSGGVRRHHTISASSRTTRASARDPISEETQEQQLWNDDEVVDQDWVGGVGAVGEKSSLHRQSSLPTRYHRAFPGQTSKTGNLTPKTMNSLSAIAGHEGDEEDWDIGGEIGRYSVHDDEHSPEAAQHQQVMDAQPQSSNQSPLSPHFVQPHVPSPPPASSSVRRHQSLTYGAPGGPRKIGSSSLKRSGTLQTPVPVHTVPQSPTPPDATEEEYIEDTNAYEEEYYVKPSQQGQYPTSTMGRSSPWTPGNEWRTPGGSGFSTSSGNSGSNVGIDDVQRALSALEIASNNSSSTNQNQNQLYQNNNPGSYQAGQSAHPPRFNPSHPPPAQAPGRRNGNGGNGEFGNGSNNNNDGGSSRTLQLVTDFDGRKTPLSQPGHGGPTSSSAYVHNQQQQQPQQQQYQQHQQSRDDRAQTAGGISWDQKDRILGGRSSNPNLQYGYQQGQGQGGQQGGKGGVPNVPPIPQQYLQQQQQQQGGVPRPGVTTSFGQQSGVGQGQAGMGQGGMGGGTGQSPQGFANTPIDVPSLIATKGYNPANFDIRPQFARFFVIKSYTEDDVHKSLKYEIWSSTDPGNKRLDKAFKECAGRGPIYLFFSVNASGHFCGMAEMLTPVDYTRSSTVWASDKWKGVFKVRWIYVRDIPNVNLRHIKLNNTQERKPVTNSRDTQELLPDAGQEMLRIFHTHPARTSLLQDFAFYELQAIQKIQAQPGPASPANSPGSSIHSPQLQSVPVSPPSVQQQQNHFGMQPNPNALAYQMPQMTPMMQMQMQMNMGMGMGSQFGIPQSQAMHQSVMRHPSPGPPGPLPVSGQGFIGMPGF